MMTRRRPDLDFRLLGHAIQHTRMFEALLIKRFPSKPDFNFDKVECRPTISHLLYTGDSRLVCRDDFTAARETCSTTSGAEQLLLDTHSLKSFLLQMPSIDSAVAAKPPTAYVGGVSAALNKAEMILKVLDMRGVKKVEQTAILQAYRQKFGAAADAAPTVPVGMGNALSATQALNAVVSMAADGLAETTSMRRLEKLVKRNF
ncbi:hypothetical protein TELCIR_22542 [Teladorsagia circumcincta]|uniref:Vacuolar protein sorting-associated protein 53 homolog n=1 Tax=Teladorsagia circumcincta TaxID=45464 RepID=A0A2G9TDM9_TELCI|nr:hypothetical protein TELCIR_22542 [Teladorsagia circumcincta]